MFKIKTTEKTIVRSQFPMFIPHSTPWYNHMSPKQADVWRLNPQRGKTSRQGLSKQMHNEYRDYQQSSGIRLLPCKPAIMQLFSTELTSPKDIDTRGSPTQSPSRSSNSEVQSQQSCILPNPSISFLQSYSQAGNQGSEKSLIGKIEIKANR